MEFFDEILEAVTTGVALLSVFVLMWGICICAYRFFKIQFTKGVSRDGLLALTESKNALGVYILLSLEILIAADIIESIVKPTFEDIFRVGCIVAIRTVISYFLNKEIHETQEMLVPEAAAAPSLRKTRSKG